ncbi:hypothetical protein J7K50_02655 [bacterium]|nr:hypothetical protein [bacterium]
MTNFFFNLPRQFIYLIIALAVFIPIILGMEMDVIPAPEAEAVFNIIEDLPDGSVILFGQDYDPSSEPELTPMTTAFLRHCFLKKHLVVSVNVFTVDGVGLGQMAFSKMEDEFGVVSGEDYVYLGFRPGVANSIRAINSDITNYYKTDANGVPSASMPIFEKVKNGKDVDFMLSIAAGATPEAWILYGASESGYPMAAGCTAVSFASYFPFYNSGQMKGILGGLKGAADYEELLVRNYPEMKEKSMFAKKGMVSQSWVHILLLVLIILGNISFIRERAITRRGGKA